VKDVDHSPRPGWDLFLDTLSTGMEKLTSVSYRKKLWVTLLVALVLLLPRWIALDRFVTVDEPDWVKFSANFYFAITHKNLDQTYQSYHPGVTTLWIGALAVFLKSPQYRGWGQGYIEDTVAFMSMLAEKGVRFLDLLVLGRQIMVMVEVAVLLALFLLIWRTFGVLAAFMCAWLMAFDAYYLGHSRLLTQEGLLSAFLLLSILAYFSFENIRREWIYLVVSGVSAGAACLTKSPGIIIIPMVVLIVLLRGWARWREPPHSTDTVRLGSHLRGVFVPLLLWAAILCCVYFVFWPSMWVDPAGTLSKVYGAAQTFVEQGDASVLTRVGEVEGFRFKFGVYLSSLLWRSSPIVWLGVLLAIVAVFGGQRGAAGRSLTPWAIITLIVFTFSFLLMMAIGGAKSGGHYIMSSHLALDIVAGLGYAVWLEALWGKAAFRLRRVWTGLAVAALALFQCMSAVWYYPYYLNYYNPLLGGPRLGAQRAGVGYGEVLDQAARYLAQLPEAEHLTAMSWYGPVSFAPFFPGKTEPLWPKTSWTERDVERLRRSDYLVVYYQHQINRNLPPKLLAGLKDVPTWHTIFVHGVEYIRIYPVDELPQQVFEPDVDQ
jgi:4-amino-4-deoxy-L-arabinose transferase-like glycosyltransferase